MDRFLKELNCDLHTVSPLTLAYIGDCVFELLVRERLVCMANRPVNDLHKLCVEQVKAGAQAAAAQKIMPLLTEKELAVYKRGRNAHSGHTPKNASGGDYHCATGFEALIGYLYLNNETQRVLELFGVICQAQEQTDAAL